MQFHCFHSIGKWWIRERENKVENRKKCNKINKNCSKEKKNIVKNILRAHHNQLNKRKHFPFLFLSFRWMRITTTTTNGIFFNSFLRLFVCVCVYVLCFVLLRLWIRRMPCHGAHSRFKPMLCVVFFFGP